MKTLENLSLQKKAKIVHQLFPKEIGEFLEYLKTVALENIDDKEEIEQIWGNQVLSANFWNGLAHLVFERIEHYGMSLKHSKQLFASQLFNSDVHVFTRHCLMKYIDAKKNNLKFSLAVKLFIEN
jgi:hypothetical protein